tara:strand:- start:52525 stop:52746 length:222 start_codon:yes stop_codon:yes gene_type:complete
MKKGDLVYLPSDIMLVGSWFNGAAENWIKLLEPTTGIIIEPNLDNENIYHRVHTKGSDWYVRTVDTMEVISRA